MKVSNWKYRLLYLPVLALLTTGGLTGAGWERPIYLSPTSINAVAADFGAYDNRAFFALTSKKDKQRYVYYTYNTNGRLKFAKPLALGGKKPPVATGNATVAIGPDKSVIIFPAGDDDGKSRLEVYTAESAEPEKFSKETDLAEGFGLVLGPQLFYSDGRFHLFYIGTVQSRFRILYTRSSDGDSWTDPAPIGEALDSGDWGNFFPGISVEGQRIDIVYQKRMGKERLDELYYVTSSDGGSSFSDPERLTDNQHQDFAPAIIRDGDDLVVAFQANKNLVWDVFLMKRTDGKWQNPRLLSGGQSQGYRPAIFRDGESRLHVVWYGFLKDAGKSRLYSYTEETSGQTFRRAVEAGPGSLRIPRRFSFKGFNGIYAVANVGGPKRIVMVARDEFVPQPEVTSNTHPPDKVMRSGNVAFKWKKPADASGLEGYGLQITKDPTTVPEAVNLGPGSQSYIRKNMPGGTWYLHLRAFDKVGNASPVVHYKFAIDRQPPLKPEIASATHNGVAANPGNKIEFNFKSYDETGVSYYQYGLNKNAGGPMPDKTEQNEITLLNRPAGTYYLRVRAVDGVGNKSPVTTYKVLVSTPKAVGGEQPGPALLLPAAAAGGVYQTPYLKIKAQASITEPIDGLSVLVSEGAADPDKKQNKKGSAFGHYFKKSGTFTINVRAKYKYSGWSAPVSQTVTMKIPAYVPGSPVQKKPEIIILAAQGVDEGGENFVPGEELPPGQELKTSRFFIGVRQPGQAAESSEAQRFTYIIQDTKTDPGKKKKDITQQLDKPVELDDGRWVIGLRVYDKQSGFSRPVYRTIRIRSELKSAPPVEPYLFAEGIVAALSVAGAGISLVLGYVFILFKTQIVFAFHKFVWMMR